MPFSFNPGQEQMQAPVTQQNNGVPILNIPVAPTITLAPVVETISPFAYKNRSKSKFNVYFQSAIFLIFGIMVIASIGLFSYQSSLKLQISSRQSDLMALESTFKKVPTEDMQRLSTRLSLINKIINERASVNTAFKILEASINSPVVYNKFSLSKSKKDNNYDLSFAGETGSYATLYQQIEVLNSFSNKNFAGTFTKIAISGIGPLDKKGIASFKVDGSVAIQGIDPDSFTLFHKNAGASSTQENVASSTTDTQISSSTQSVGNSSTASGTVTGTQ